MESFRTSLAFVATLFATLFGILYAQNTTCSRHESLRPVQNFSIEKILGDWIAFKSYAGRNEDAVSPGYSCLEANLSIFYPPSGPFLKLESYLLEGDSEISNSNTGIGVRADNPAIWSMYGQSSPVDGNFYNSHAVFTHADYDNYAVQFSCMEKESDIYEQMIIWTRSREPDPELIALLQFLVENDGFSLENEIPISQSNCDVKFN